ncbi:MAG: hypothetical protein JHC93_04395 [Parachlamydiales bacterium]|nr:hypothetical protein [Parachlamydiales bacterium]
MCISLREILDSPQKCIEQKNKETNHLDDKDKVITEIRGEILFLTQDVLDVTIKNIELFQKLQKVKKDINNLNIFLYNFAVQLLNSFEETRR